MLKASLKLLKED